MPIMRAGPFADSTSSFRGRDDEEETNAPVNCATSWLGANWKFRLKRTIRPLLSNTPQISLIQFHTNLYDEFDDIGVTGEGIELSYLWYYQSSKITDFSIDYSLFADPEAGSIAECSIDVTVDNIGVYFDSAFSSNPGETAELIGDELITLPIAVKPVPVLIRFTAAFVADNNNFAWEILINLAP